MQHNERTDAEYRPENRGYYEDDSLRCDKNSSADELEECTASTRQNMDRTLRSLEDKVSPGRVWGRTKESFRSKVGETLDIDREVRRNPIPFAMIGAGLILVGAGVATFALSKMRESAAKHQASSLPQESEAEFTRSPGGEPVVTSESWAEPYVTPETGPIQGTVEEEATTEEIQKERVEEKGEENVNKKTEHGTNF